MADDLAIEQLVRDRLTKNGDLIVARIKEKLIAQGKVASGQLLDSIGFDLKVENGIISLNILSNDYFYYVDQGRKPGKQPPIFKILQWMDFKNIRPISTGIPKNRFGLPRADRSLAFLIARKIGRDGIKGTGILSSTMEETNDPLVHDLTALITQAIVDIIGKDMLGIAQEVNSSILNMTVNYF